MREVCEPVSSMGGSSFRYFQSAAINFCHELTTQQVWGDCCLYPLTTQQVWGDCCLYPLTTQQVWGDCCLDPLIVQGPFYGPISKTLLITLSFTVSESPQHVAFEPYPLA